MNWIDSILDSLSGKPCCGYGTVQPPASEPTALAALALWGHGRHEPAKQAADWLVKTQAEDGSVSVRRGLDKPCWPTALAVMTWISTGNSSDRYLSAIENAVTWTLSIRGKAQPRRPETGHDTTLAAWPWVEGTHGWIEPTALHLLALKATGRGNHARAREAVRMLIDRQLPQGGCNYGNTIVLGQTLRPHLQPTGIAMLALSGEEDKSQRIERSLNYLSQNLDRQTPTASLCWSLMGLAAHGHSVASRNDWLQAAYQRTENSDRSPYKLALLALAALQTPSPFGVSLQKLDGNTT